MEINALNAPQPHKSVRKPSYLTKGRTGREGSNLKILGVLALAIGAAWATSALFLAGGALGLAGAVGTLLVGAILLWSGLVVTKNS